MKVPRGKLLPASFRSPDMLTPWVKPVTAGKKMAKITQKPRPPSGAVQFWTSSVWSHLAIPPMKKDKRAATRMVITRY